MGCAHDGVIIEEIRKRFVYRDDPDNGEWDMMSRVETCEYCGEIVNPCQPVQTSPYAHLDKANPERVGCEMDWIGNFLAGLGKRILRL